MANYGDGTIDQRASGWRVRIPMGDGTRHSESGIPTKAEAQRRRRELVIERDRGRLTRTGRNTTLATALDDRALLKATTMSPRTIGEWATLRRRLSTQFLDLPLHRLDRRALDLEFARLRTAGLSEHRLDTMWTMIRAALGQAVDYGTINNIPKLSAPPNPPPSSVTAPSDDTVRRLLDHAGEHRLMYLLLARTGIRRGELAALKWTDIDPTAGKLNISRAAIDHPTGIIIKTTKGRNRRDIPLGPDLITHLTQHRRQQNTASLATGHGRGGPWIFTDPNTGHQNMRPDGISSRFALTRTRAGITSTRCHDLRHYFATTLLRDGVRIDVVSKLLGHHDITITLRTYSHIITTDTTAAVEQLATHLA